MAPFRFHVFVCDQQKPERVAGLWPRLPFAAFGAAPLICFVRRRGAAAWVGTAAILAAAVWALLSFATRAAAQTVAPAASPAPAAAPAVLPGKGLAQHDFFYAGESKEERM